MLDELFTSLKELDDRLETFVDEPVAAFGEQLATLFKDVPTPDAGKELEKVEEEIRQIKSNPKELKRSMVLTVPDKQPPPNPKMVRLGVLYDMRTNLISTFLKDETVRTFKKNLVYMLERIQDIILKKVPVHRDVKIRFVDSALRQVEIVCSPVGVKDPTVDHVEGVSTQFADPTLVEDMPAMQAEFQLKMSEFSNGKRTGTIIKTGE